MSKKQKQLLLIDLCARLPYGVKTTNGNGILELSPRTDIIYIVDNGHIPYLRPMSSMTEEEKSEYHKTHEVVLGVHMIKTLKSYDWLNAHHFDYRGLIEKGLALEAPEGMYKTE